MKNKNVLTSEESKVTESSLGRLGVYVIMYVYSKIVFYCVYCIMMNMMASKMHFTIDSYTYWVFQNCNVGER